MSRGRATFRESDMTRIFRAARKAGIDVQIKIERDGTMIVKTAPAAMQPEDSEHAQNEWDTKYGAA